MHGQTEGQPEPVLTRVWLLRHAETADPTVFHGAESDIGLSERGQRLAEELAPWIAAQRPDCIYASGMRRARDTAAPFARTCGLPVQVEPDLYERRVGVLTRQPFHAFDGLWEETLRRWIAGETGFAPEGAESFDEIQARVLPAWQRLTNRHAGQTLVVVAHGVVCKVLLTSLGVGFGIADWKRLGSVENLGLHELVGGAGRWQLLRLNYRPPTHREPPA
ncbi:MAG: histidine phosphatase family protein [Planctomycetia bacterium]|nr:histidine phosphatase family protein [Planctomycetia bacterium]